MVGVGFTLIVKDLLVPLQALLNGVTVNWELIGMIFELVALKEEISPDPKDGIPISGSVCDQLY